MRLSDPAAVRPLLRICRDYPEPDVLISDVAARGAILTGHFRLLSGRHARHFLRFAQLGWHGPTCERIADSLLAMAPFVKPGGVLLAAESAASLLAARMAQSGRGLALALCGVGHDRRPIPRLIHGTIAEGQSVVLVADVATTGVSLGVLEQVAREAGGVVRGVVCFAAFDPDALGERYPKKFAWCVQPLWPTWERPARCPACREELELFPASELN